MPDTEADRIVRQHRDQLKAEKRKNKQFVPTKRASRATIDALKNEIPIVLQLLVDLGYPNMQELVVHEDVPWFMFWHPRKLPGYERYRIRYRAAWRLFDWEYPYMDSVAYHSIDLLSDGDFYSDWLTLNHRNRHIWSLHDLEYDTYSPFSLAEFALTGLRDLQRKLEEMKRVR